MERNGGDTWTFLAVSPCLAPFSGSNWAAGGFNFTISDGLCTHFKIAKIDTKKMVDGLDIQAPRPELREAKS